MDNWRKQMRKDGRVYFYNVVTDRRQWKAPACWVDPPSSSDSEASGPSTSSDEGDEGDEGRGKGKRGKGKHGKKHRRRRKHEDGSDGAGDGSASASASADLSNAEREGKQTLMCVHCGASNVATAKFCHECGRNLREMPKYCQMDTCRSFGVAKSVVYSSDDDMLTRRNDGRTIHLCYRCGELIKAFPLFENVEMQQVADVPEDVDDGRSVIRWGKRSLLCCVCVV